MKTYKIETEFGDYEVAIELDSYRTDGSLAIELIDVEEQWPFAMITVCLPEEGIAGDNFTFIDTNNCPWAPEFIRNNHLGVPTGNLGFSGFCTYPLYNMDLNKLRE